MSGNILADDLQVALSPPICRFPSWIFLPGMAALSAPSHPRPVPGYASLCALRRRAAHSRSTVNVGLKASVTKITFAKESAAAPCVVEELATKCCSGSLAVRRRIAAAFSTVARRRDGPPFTIPPTMYLNKEMKQSSKSEGGTLCHHQRFVCRNTYETGSGRSTVSNSHDMAAPRQLFIVRAKTVVTVCCQVNRQLSAERVASFAAIFTKQIFDRAGRGRGRRPSRCKPRQSHEPFRGPSFKRRYE